MSYLSFLKKSSRPIGDDCPYDWLLVGLGNPGAKYLMTPHNAGFWTVDRMTQRFSTAAFEEFPKLHATEVSIGSSRNLLVKPQTFMNKSGEAVQFCMQRLKFPRERFLIIHDELDLPPGEVRLKKGGGSGGNNGLKSIISCTGGKDFLRLRIGIGRPPKGMDSAAHVLKPIAREDETVYREAIEDAIDAVELLINEGVDAAMNKVNQRRPVRNGNPSGNDGQQASSAGQSHEKTGGSVP